jgi:hypothetical protein
MASTSLLCAAGRAARNERRRGEVASCARGEERGSGGPTAVTCSCAIAYTRSRRPGAPRGPQVAASAAPASGSACVVSYMGRTYARLQSPPATNRSRCSSQARVSGDRAETLARRGRRALWRSRGPPPMPVVCVSIRRPPAERTNCGASLERPAGQSKADRLSAFTRRSPAARSARRRSGAGAPSRWRARCRRAPNGWRS